MAVSNLPNNTWPFSESVSIGSTTALIDTFASPSLISKATFPFGNSAFDKPFQYLLPLNGPTSTNGTVIFDNVCRSVAINCTDDGGGAFAGNCKIQGLYRGQPLTFIQNLDSLEDPNNYDPWVDGLNNDTPQRAAWDTIYTISFDTNLTNGSNTICAGYGCGGILSWYKFNNYGDNSVTISMQNLQFDGDDGSNLSSALMVIYDDPDKYSQNDLFTNPYNQNPYVLFVVQGLQVGNPSFVFSFNKFGMANSAEGNLLSALYSTWPAAWITVGIGLDLTRDSFPLIDPLFDAKIIHTRT